jgi:hypothetical protein
VRASLTSLIFFGLLIAAFVHYGNHLPQFKPDSSSDASLEPESRELDPGTADNQGLDPDQAIKNPSKVMNVDGPLARWMKNLNPNNPDKRTPWKAHANDHIAPSPAGTSGVVLHQTFPVARGVSFPFTIPAHAATPQLRGTFQSALQAHGDSTSESPDIAFLLLNQEEYDNFLHGHLGNSLIAVDSSHNQDVNFGLPASFDQPATYYLVFRNNPRYPRKTVQADFKVNF